MATPLTAPPGGFGPGRPPIEVELLGPAGCGKTTLVAALRDQGLRFRDGVRPCEASCAPLVARSVFRLPPRYVLGALRPTSRTEAWWSPRDSLRSMVYLELWLRPRGEESAAGRDIVVFDHGPLFRLGTLGTWGPPGTRRFVEWWETMRRAWRKRLSLVVWLDAPDSVLLERIRRRDRWHPCQGMTDSRAFEWLDAYRRALHRALGPAREEDGPDIVSFDTGAKEAGMIAAALAPRLGEPG